MRAPCAPQDGRSQDLAVARHQDALQVGGAAGPQRRRRYPSLAPTHGPPLAHARRPAGAQQRPRRALQRDAARRRARGVARAAQRTGAVDEAAGGWGRAHGPAHAPAHGGPLPGGARAWGVRERGSGAPPHACPPAAMHGRATAAMQLAASTRRDAGSRRRGCKPLRALPPRRAPPVRGRGVAGAGVGACRVQRGAADRGRQSRQAWSPGQVAGSTALRSVRPPPGPARGGRGRGAASGAAARERAINLRARRRGSWRPQPVRRPVQWGIVAPGTVPTRPRGQKGAGELEVAACGRRGPQPTRTPHQPGPRCINSVAARNPNASAMQAVGCLARGMAPLRGPSAALPAPLVRQACGGARSTGRGRTRPLQAPVR
jgi:hypothetical protein